MTLVKTLPKLILATRNIHKTEEIRKILEGMAKLVDLVELNYPGELDEDGSSLEENALQKAHTVHAQFGLPALADDSGLEVEALGGAPGLHSARFAGPGKDAGDNIRLLLKKLNGVQNRHARFRTVIALAGDSEEKIFEGVIEGSILTESRGANGFGYDPVFQPEGYNRSFAEMQPDEKNKISHRALALEKLVAYLTGK